LWRMPKIRALCKKLKKRRGQILFQDGKGKDWVYQKNM